MKQRYSFFIGRYQPLHEGHKKLIQTAIDEGKPVLIGLMDTEKDTKNPYSAKEREEMFKKAFGNKVKVITIPPIGEVCYGRNVGYWLRRIHLPAEIEAINATDIRNDSEPQVPANLWHDSEFVDAWNRMAQRVHYLSAKQGFWKDGTNRNIGEVIALGHSEFSEAMECFRFGNPTDKNITSMSGGEVQLSDVLGILLDMSAGYGLKIAQALEKKMQFNETRGYMHGGKKF